MAIQFSKISLTGLLLLLISLVIAGCGGGGSGSSNNSSTGNVSLDNSLTGFATLNGGTTGGSGCSSVTVSTVSELQNAIISNKIIYVDGTITQKSRGDAINIQNVSNLSIIGVTDRGELSGIGINVKNSSNIIIRNLTIHHVEHQFDNPNTSSQQELTFGDAIGVDSSKNIWVDHCTLYNAGVDTAAQNKFKQDLINQGYSEDVAENWEGSPKNLYDGLFDVKGSSEYITFSWNKVSDSWKTCLVGSSDSDNSDRKITYHHNWFKNCYSRLPMYRGGVGHIYNNYYSGILGSGINSRAGATLLIENNYFENVENAIQSSNSTGTWLATGNNSNNGGSASVTVSYTYSLQTAADAKASVEAGAGVGKLSSTNTAPAPRSTIPTQSMTVGNSDTFTASDIATDTDSDTLSITQIVTLPDATVVSAALNSGTITLTGLAAGTASMVVTVSDGKATVDITVPVKVTSGTVTNLELNATSVGLSTLQGLVLPATYNGFILGSDITFDTSTEKIYNSNSYSVRIKLGGSSTATRGITFAAKAGDALTVLAMSSSSTGTGRNVMVAPVADGTTVTGTSLGESGTANITAHTYTLPSDGTYVVYSSSSGINIYYISVIGS